MDQASNWTKRQKEDRTSSAAVLSIVEKERLTREGEKELRDKREREVLSSSDTYKLFKCNNRLRLEEEGPWTPGL